MGLELDKMNISGARTAGAASSGGYRAGKCRGGSGDSGRRWAILRLVLPAVGVSSLIALLLLLWNQGIIDLPFLQSKKTLRHIERIATIGPVMTSIGENDQLKLTLQIECRNSKLKERLAEIGPAAKSKILIVLNSPETIELLHRQDYAHLKDFFKTEIQELLPKNSIREIYLSEIVRY